MIKEIKYLISNAFSFLFQILIIFFLDIFLQNENFIIIISIVLVFIFNFLGLKFFVYKNHSNMTKQFLSVFQVSIVSRFIEFIIFYFANTILNINYMIIYLFILVLSNIIKFFLYKKIFD